MYERISLYQNILILFVILSSLINQIEQALRGKKFKINKITYEKKKEDTHRIDLS